MLRRGNDAMINDVRCAC